MAGEAASLVARFRERYPATAPPRVSRAPGRVNLIGEHTDYNLGFVLPVAIELACYTASAPSGDRRLRVYSEELEQGAEWPVEAIAALQPQRHWTDYVVGVAQELLRLGIPVEGRNVLIHSTVPAGSGLSSSAALEVSSALALAGERRLDPLELARLCHRAENGFVGLPSGLMDQFVSVFGQKDAAIRLDCRSLEHAVVQLPPQATFLAVNSMVKHELGASAYRQRVAECAAAVNALRRKWPGVASLREATPAMLDGGIPEPALRRARHVVTENRRVGEFVEAAGRADLVTMGRLMAESHRSLQIDYEVSCAELDFLVDAAQSLPGVFGARMTGGGFGGCTVNLVSEEIAPEFASSIRPLYQNRFGIDPEIYSCRPSPGAETLIK
ncbi:MAG: galactokinase [Bryobacteraceae bacterium]